MSHASNTEYNTEDSEDKKYMRRDRVMKLWTTEENNKLLELASMYQCKWSSVADELPNRNQSQCAQRYRRLVKNTQRKCWTKQEDDQLIELYAKYQRNWQKIAQQIPGRIGKQVRERYQNKLDPNINKNQFTKKEDEMIIQLKEKLGSHWKDIAQSLPGRTENQIKNRFYSHIQRFILNNKQKGGEDDQSINGQQQQQNIQNENLKLHNNYLTGVVDIVEKGDLKKQCSIQSQASQSDLLKNKEKELDPYQLNLQLQEANKSIQIYNNQEIPDYTNTQHIQDYQNSKDVNTKDEEDLPQINGRFSLNFQSPNFQPMKSSAKLKDFKFLYDSFPSFNHINSTYNYETTNSDKKEGQDNKDIKLITDMSEFLPPIQSSLKLFNTSSVQQFQQQQQQQLQQQSMISPYLMMNQNSQRNFNTPNRRPKISKFQEFD